MIFKLGFFDLEKRFGNRTKVKEIRNICRKSFKKRLFLRRERV